MLSGGQSVTARGLLGRSLPSKDISKGSIPFDRRNRPPLRPPERTGACPQVPAATVVVLRSQRHAFRLWQFGSFVHAYKWKKVFSNCHQNPTCRFCRQEQRIYLRKQKKLPKLSYYVRTKASKPRLFVRVKTLLQPKAFIQVRYNRTAL